MAINIQCDDNKLSPTRYTITHLFLIQFVSHGIFPFKNYRLQILFANKIYSQRKNRRFSYRFFNITTFLLEQRKRNKLNSILNTQIKLCQNQKTKTVQPEKIGNAIVQMIKQRLHRNSSKRNWFIIGVVGCCIDLPHTYARGDRCWIVRQRLTVVDSFFGRWFSLAELYRNAQRNRNS